MTRCLTVLAWFVVAAPAFAGVMPPVPRVIVPTIPDQPDANPPADPNDPAATAERIAKSAKDVGDKLANDDTGADTLVRQEQIKKDIESLIKSMENPPPMGGGGGGSPPPMGGVSPPPMGGGGQPPPMGGAKSGRKPRGQQPPPMGGQPPPPMPMGGEQKQPAQPMPMGGEPKPADAQKQPAAGKPEKGGAAPGGGGMTTPTLPLEDRIARDFWGNLPDQPRERMMQFFREQYMSRYKDLLPQYYQSLAEKEKKGKK